MTNHKFSWTTLAALGALALTACGGGGGDPPTAAVSAEGGYAGTLTGSSSSAFRVLVLEDGQYWALYGTDSGGTLFVNGLIQGQGTTGNGTFTSSNLRDFGYQPALAGTLNATFVSGTSISGSATINGQVVGLNGTTSQAGSISYNTPATISSVAGQWSLSSTSGGTISLNIASDGAFTATGSNGCQISGTVVPRASGKNVLNVSLTFGPAPCGLPGQQAAGIAVRSTLPTGGAQLTVAVIDSTRTYGSAAFGKR